MAVNKSINDNHWLKSLCDFLFLIIKNCDININNQKTAIIQYYPALSRFDFSMIRLFVKLCAQVLV